MSEAREVTEDEVGRSGRRARGMDRRSASSSSASRRRERKIEIASSRERAYGPLAAEVATFDAALVIGQGPPIPIGDAVHMVMERVTLPGAREPRSRSPRTSASRATSPTTCQT